jgi:23S rRNA (uridine2552-2'-O)-methyltransferase
MAKRSSSARWRRRQDADPYVQRAQKEGWRSRAVFKLDEIQNRDRLIRAGGVVVDLGAAPGSWSQYAVSKLGEKGRVIAVDLLPMEPLSGVHYIQGDFSDETILETLLCELGDAKADLVLSDLAPNISGNRSVDQPRAMYLAELALELAVSVLNKDGAFVCKLFHGEGFDDFIRDCRQRFKQVKVRKPAASRPASRETYLVARTIRI